MVFGFAKQSGGHVTIDSEVGEGTTVKLYLPRHVGGLTVEHERKSHGDLETARGEVILVVEDDADLRTLVINMLDSLDYEVLEAGSAKSALTYFGETTRVNLLLTDIVLPGGMSGRELAETVRARDPKLAVLFMSGYTEDPVVHHGRLDEGIPLLQKPFPMADLARKVREVLDQTNT